MSNSKIRSLDQLPSEILYRIFDFLDAQTIFFNLRSICKRFQSLVETFHRYRIDCRQITIEQFKIINRKIPPENFIALILCGSFDAFNSKINLRSYVRLESFSLMKNTDLEENRRHRSANGNSLALRPVSTNRDQRILLVFFGTPTLRRVRLNGIHRQIVKSNQQQSFFIEHLTLDQITNIDNLCILLDRCPQLRKLVLISPKFSTWKCPLTPISSVKSLSIENFQGFFSRFELLLLKMPKLTEFRITGETDRFDVKRWEKFVRMNLMNLKCFHIDVRVNLNRMTVEDLIDFSMLFQSAFWQEEKKWFVTCLYRKYPIHALYLYSSPISSTDIIEDVRTVFRTSIFENNGTFHLNLNENFIREVEIEFEQNSRLIRRIHSSSRMEIEDYGLYENNEYVWILLEKILNKTTKLTHFVFQPVKNGRFSTKLIDKIITFLPTSLCYLNLPVTSQTQIVWIEDRFKDLSLMSMTMRNVLTLIGEPYVMASIGPKSENYVRSMHLESFLN